MKELDFFSESRIEKMGLVDVRLTGNSIFTTHIGFECTSTIFEIVETNCNKQIVIKKYWKFLYGISVLI